MLILLTYALSFVAIGLWGGLYITGRKLFPREFLYITSLAVSLVLSYFLFFIYAISPTSGHIVTIGMLLLGLIALVSIILSCRKTKKIARLIGIYFLPPLVIIVAVFIGYNTLLYGCRLPVPEQPDTRRPVNQSFCAIQNMPLDNGLPLMYASFTLQNQEKSLVIDWTIADRPPLQIGTSLPIVDLLQNSKPIALTHYYNLFSIFLQLSWVGAVWGLLQWLRVRGRLQALLLIGFCATGFFYLNSIFVWPKFLAAALVLAALAPYIGKKLDNQLLKYVPASAVLLSLGLMAHTSAMFTLIPAMLILIYKLYRVKKSNWKLLVLAGALALCVLAPWQMFKGTITSSDRLVKYHFADVTSYEDTRGTLQTIVQQYQKLTFHQWLHNKVQNVQTLFDSGFRLWVDCNPLGSRSDKNCSDWKSMTFFSTFFSLEVYALGFLSSAYQAIRRRLDPFDKEAWLIVAGTLIVWVLLMFHPGGTVVHQGSYATMLLLFILLGRSLARLPISVLIALTGLQIITFYRVWIAPFDY